VGSLASVAEGAGSLSQARVEKEIVPKDVDIGWPEIVRVEPTSGITANQFGRHVAGDLCSAKSRV
jgi:hypothetical protein